jgi:hypothetical protein
MINLETKKASSYSLKHATKSSFGWQNIEGLQNDICLCINENKTWEIIYGIIYKLTIFHSVLDHYLQKDVDI